MEFLSRLHTKDIKEQNFLFQIDRIRVYSSLSAVDESQYYDICGFLFKESDIICSVHNNKPPSRDEIRAALVAMHSLGALKPTEESANFLYKMLAGCKKKKSRGKKDEDDEEELNNPVFIPQSPTSTPPSLRRKQIQVQEEVHIIEQEVHIIEEEDVKIPSLTRSTDVDHPRQADMVQVKYDEVLPLKKIRTNNKKSKK